MEQILALGFSEAAAAHFLDQCDGDVRRAVNAILANPDWEPLQPPSPEAASIAEAKRLLDAEREAQRIRMEEQEAASIALARQLMESERMQASSYSTCGGLQGVTGGPDLIDLLSEPEPEPEPQPQLQPEPPPQPQSQANIPPPLYSVEPLRSHLASHIHPPPPYGSDSTVAARVALQQQDEVNPQRPQLHAPVHPEYEQHNAARVTTPFVQQDEIEALRRRLAETEKEMINQQVAHQLEKEDIARRLKEEQDEKQQAMRRWQRDQHKVKRAEVTAADAAVRASALEEVAARNAAEREELQATVRRNAAADYLAFPDYWDPFPDEQTHHLEVELVDATDPAKAAERDRVYQRFLRQWGGATQASHRLRSLKRIQDKDLWRRYAQQREILRKKASNVDTQ